MQYDVGHLLSLFVSLGYVCIRPSPQLHPVRPARRLVCLVVLAPVVFFMATKVAGQGIAIGLLKRQSWYCPTENQVLQACAWHAFELYSWHDLSKPKGLRDSAHHFFFQQLWLTLPISCNLIHFLTIVQPPCWNTETLKCRQSPFPKAKSNCAAWPSTASKFCIY